MNKNFRDIRVGGKVEVTYYGRYGKLFADAIDIATRFSFANGSMNKKT